MSEWWDTLPGIWDRAWQTLQRGTHDRHAAARHVSLATVAPDGAPEVRTVILRAADREAAHIDIHTDLRSGKVAALRAHPAAEAMAWDPRARLQIRLAGPVEVLSGEVVAPLWARVPDQARVSYGNAPGPGVPIADALAYGPGDGATVFAVLRVRVARLDALHLGDAHRRAQFRRTDGWQAQWLSP